MVSHLTFPGEAKPIDTAKDLVSQKDLWTWGYDELYDSGWEWFKRNDNPVIEELFKYMIVRNYTMPSFIFKHVHMQIYRIVLSINFCIVYNLFVLLYP